MKTFEEIKQELENYLTLLLQENEEKLIIIREEENKSLELKTTKYIETIKNNLDNIDEVTTIYIGSRVNNIIKIIREVYKKRPDSYKENYEKFLKKWLFGIHYKESEPDKVIVKEISDLGLHLDDFNCLKETNPLDENFGDPLRQKVNRILGTNIPMSGLVEQAKKDLAEAPDEEKEIYLVKYKELQRDAGLLTNGKIFYPLESNPIYQECKQNIRKKTK